MSRVPGITYQANLPLKWHVDKISDNELERMRHANLALLQALAMLESSADKDHDADPIVAKSIERLEAKLDIALNLLSRLVAQQAEPPPAVAVTLAAHYIEWREETALLIPGATVLLALHLSPRLPEPLQFYGRITSVQSGICTAKFMDNDDELEEWMTRTLFRYHRRQLQARHHL